MYAIRPHRAPFTLSVDDKCRLHKLAPFFGIRFRAVDEQTYVRGVPGKQSAVDISLPSAIGHLRLIAEMCARSAKWVHFHFGESCRDSPLGQTDARLRRVAAFYALDTLGSVSIRKGEVTVRFVPKADCQTSKKAICASAKNNRRDTHNVLTPLCS